MEPAVGMTERVIGFPSNRVGRKRGKSRLQQAETRVRAGWRHPAIPSAPDRQEKLLGIKSASVPKPTQVEW